MGLEARGQRVGRRVPSRSSIGGTGPLTKCASLETDQSSNRRAAAEARARCSGREGVMLPKRKLSTVHAGGPMTSVQAPGKRSKNAVSPPVERTRPLFTSMPMTSSPHPTTKSTSLLRLREFVWVGGCVTAPTAWASPHWRRGPHRQGDDAGVYTNRWKWPLGAVSGHLCTLLRRGLGLWVALGSQ